MFGERFLVPAHRSLVQPILFVRGPAALASAKRTSILHRHVNGFPKVIGRAGLIDRALGHQHSDERGPRRLSATDSVLDARALGGAAPDVVRGGSNETPRCSLLAVVRSPTDDAARGEYCREEGARYAERFEQHGGVKLDVGAEGPVRMSFGEETRRALLYSVRDGQACARLPVRTFGAGKLARAVLDRAFEDERSRIANAVDAVPIPMRSNSQ